MNFLYVAIYGFGFWLFPAIASAQLTLALPEAESRHNFSLGVKLEPELTNSFTYTHALNPDNQRIKLHVWAGITLLPLILGSGNWRTHLITAADWRPARQWGATIATQVYLAQVHNRAGKMHGLGVEARFMPSHYGAHWTTGVDLGWQSTLITHIKHASATKETFQDRYPAPLDYRGPVNGWYGSTAHRFRMGLVGARRLFKHVAFQLAAGSIFFVQKQGIAFGFSHAQVPLYAETMIRVHW